ncbi:prepilin peptidase [Candidatus Dojkabacteria bacterium]|nr:prepilin peptidase [Candidatus Dojkabacteria bacterium]
MSIYLVLFSIVFVFGLCIGSFITVLVPRIRAKKKFINDRSECPHCKHKLGPLELIPLLSYFLQGGKCKHCRKQIPEYYPFVEVVTGAVFVLSQIRFIGEIDLLSTDSIFRYLAFALLIGLFLSIFVFFAAYDYCYQEVPDKLSIPLVAILVFVNLALFVYKGFSLSSSISIDNVIIIYPFFNIISGIVSALFIAVLVFVTKGEGMGGGDIRIAAMLGLISSWKGSVVGFYIAFVIGSIIGLIVAIKKGKLRGLRLPFVPFLSIGAVFGFLFSKEIFGFIFPLL